MTVGTLHPACSGRCATVRASPSGLSSQRCHELSASSLRSSLGVFVLFASNGGRLRFRRRPPASQSAPSDVEHLHTSNRIEDGPQHRGSGAFLSISTHWDQSGSKPISVCRCWATSRFFAADGVRPAVIAPNDRPGWKPTGTETDCMLAGQRYIECVSSSSRSDTLRDLTN